MFRATSLKIYYFRLANLRASELPHFSDFAPFGSFVVQYLRR